MASLLRRRVLPALLSVHHSRASRAGYVRRPACKPVLAFTTGRECDLHCGGEIAPGVELEVAPSYRELYSRDIFERLVTGPGDVPKNMTSPHANMLALHNALKEEH
ncbi:hypothetical protein NQZ68_035256 [Dissostichus eleginoides]|nr:hypothetical protein NQZ68_035256 [Dissostichus eleginoides]